MFRSVVITLVWIALFYFILLSSTWGFNGRQLTCLSIILGIFGSLLGEILTDLKNR